MKLAKKEASYMHPLPADRGPKSRTRSSTARNPSCLTRRKTGRTR